MRFIAGLLLVIILGGAIYLAPFLWIMHVDNVRSAAAAAISETQRHAEFVAYCAHLAAGGKHDEIDDFLFAGDGRDCARPDWVPDGKYHGRE